MVGEYSFNPSKDSCGVRCLCGRKPTWVVSIKMSLEAKKGRRMIKNFEKPTVDLDVGTEAREKCRVETGEVSLCIIQKG
jgi:hypothetical protein